jgi:hypothetical protein
MTALLGDLVEAQSAAVRGERVDADELHAALRAVANVDGEYGTALQTSQRLTELTDKVETALRRAETGRAAYETYSGLVTLALDLTRRIGDTSHLVHDPDLDSFYLMDAAIVRLPTAMVYAGRAADLVALAGGRTLTGEDAISAAVARFGVSTAAQEVSDGLTKSVDFTARSELGTNIADRLDTFTSAADAFAPPTMLRELSGAVADAAVLGANARRVYATALPLAHRLLSELQALLKVRRADLAEQRRFTAVAAGVAACLGVLMALLLALGRRRSASAMRPDDLPILTDARTVLDAQRLVHLGRQSDAR